MVRVLHRGEGLINLVRHVVEMWMVLGLPQEALATFWLFTIKYMNGKKDLDSSYIVHASSMVFIQTLLVILN